MRLKIELGSDKDIILPVSYNHALQWLVYKFFA